RVVTPRSPNLYGLHRDGYVLLRLVFSAADDGDHVQIEDGVSVQLQWRLTLPGVSALVREGRISLFRDVLHNTLLIDVFDSVGCARGPRPIERGRTTGRDDRRVSPERDLPPVRWELRDVEGLHGL